MTQLPHPPAGSPPPVPGRRLIPATLAVALAAPLGGLVAAVAIAAPGSGTGFAAAEGSSLVALDILGAVLAIDVAVLAVLRVLLTGMGAPSSRRAGLPELSGKHAPIELAADK